MLAGTLPAPPNPTVLQRDDGIGLFYRGEVNLVFGDPEQGKTWLVYAAAVEQLERGHKVLMLDLDHNGPSGTVSKLLMLGADKAALTDIDRFRYIEPDDRLSVLQVVEDCKIWRPHLASVDSLGELMPMFGSSSNSADEFTQVHTRVLKPLAKSGAAVLVLDHLSKGAESRQSGPGGTAAKRRAIGGSSVRVTAKEAFTPGKGGKAYLAINKDRHGGLRQHCPTGDKEPLAGVFELLQFNDSVLSHTVTTPKGGERNPGEAAPEDDVKAVANLGFPPTVTVNEVQQRLRWNRQRAAKAVKQWKASVTANVIHFPGTPGGDAS